MQVPPGSELQRRIKPCAGLSNMFGMLCTDDLVGTEFLFDPRGAWRSVIEIAPVHLCDASRKTHTLRSYTSSLASICFVKPKGLAFQDRQCTQLPQGLIDDHRARGGDV